MSSGTRLATVTLLVRDYDEAASFFVDTLGFDRVEDHPVGEGKRWLVVRPPGGGAALLLAKAATEEQAARVGDQAGGRVFLFLKTGHFRADYERMRARGVVFREAPRQEPYGTVAVFEDVCGNAWDLIEPRRAP